MSKKETNKSTVLIPEESIENKIFLIRGKKVMLDRDLAKLYEMETKYLNRQVKRNIERFPEEFMFQFNREEKYELVTNCHRFKTLKHSSTLPYVFTEHGVSMLSSVLRSKIAVKIGIHSVKIFIWLREFVESHKDLACKLRKLEQEVGKQGKDITAIVELIKRLVSEPEKSKGKIGFHP